MLALEPPQGVGHENGLSIEPHVPSAGIAPQGQ
jgi:hypothetical protein